MNRSVLHFLMIQVAGGIISVGGNASYALILGPSDLGRFYFFLSCVYLGSLLVSFGIAERVQNEAAHGRSFAITLGFWLLSRVVLAVLLGAVAVLSAQPSMWLAAYPISFVLMAVLSILLVDFQDLLAKLQLGAGRSSQAATTYFLSQSFAVALGLALLLVVPQQYRMIAPYAGFVVAQLLAVAWALRKVNVAFAAPTWKNIGDVLGFGIPALLPRATVFVWEWFPIFLFGLLLLPQEAAIYGLAWRLASVLLLPGNAFAAVFFRDLARASSGGPMLSSLVARGLQFSLLAPAVALAAGIPGTILIVGALVGTQDQMSLTLFGTVFVARILQSPASVLGPSLLATGSSIGLGKAYLVAALASAVLESMAGYLQPSFIAAGVVVGITLLSGSLWVQIRRIAHGVSVGGLAWITLAAMIGFALSAIGSFIAAWRGPGLLFAAALGAVSSATFLVFRSDVREDLLGLVRGQSS